MRTVFGAGTKIDGWFRAKLAVHHPYSDHPGPFPPDYVTVIEQMFEESNIGIIAMDVEESILPRRE